MQNEPAFEPGDYPGMRLDPPARAEVGQSRLGTHRRELGTIDVDLVVALGTRVGKSFECGAGHGVLCRRRTIDTVFAAS